MIPPLPFQRGEGRGEGSVCSSGFTHPPPLLMSLLFGLRPPGILAARLRFPRSAPLAFAAGVSTPEVHASTRPYFESQRPVYAPRARSNAPANSPAATTAHTTDSPANRRIDGRSERKFRTTVRTPQCRPQLSRLPFA